jgi:beta-1,2-mannobiose phosphorylase / 1,2-beta-oligomannan phosphorylase
MIASAALAPAWVRRLGIVMEPDLTDPREVGGALNPAAARGPDGQLYLLPRLVAAGNYSRIGLARVVFDRRGDPAGVERVGIALEPQEPYELNPVTGGGVEDPRVTYLEASGEYVMMYTAYGPDGPRIAAAVSRDLARWRRTGPVRFAPYYGVDMGAQHNKDAVLFPEPVQAPDGRPALALLHRPTFSLPSADDGPTLLAPHQVRSRPSIWISYAPLDTLTDGPRLVFGQHHLVAAPRQDWEALKVGAGTPPVRLREGWLVLYHGVGGQLVDDAEQPQDLHYSAGALVLDGKDPRRVIHRSARSILAPQTAAERMGIVPRVVFPTGLDRRADGTLDVFYGMADSRIGVARVDTRGLQPGALAAAA